MHKIRQIGLNCAINCGIRENDSNKNLIKYKNLFHGKSISNLVQRLARYRIVSLISIGRLCISAFNSIMNERKMKKTPHMPMPLSCRFFVKFSKCCNKLWVFCFNVCNEVETIISFANLCKKDEQKWWNLQVIKGIGH